MKNGLPCLCFAFAVTTAPLVMRAENATTNVPVPTIEQRLAAVEAYILNGDPTAALKDKDGKIPPGLTVPTAGVPGPGANAWQMARSSREGFCRPYLSRRRSD